MIYKIKDGFIIRKIGSQIMAVPVGQQTSELHGMIALSESGELLWNVLVNGADTEQLTNILLENYEVSRERAAEDIDKFLLGLREQGALE